MWQLGPGYTRSHAPTAAERSAEPDCQPMERRPVLARGAVMARNHGTGRALPQSSSGTTTCTATTATTCRRRRRGGGGAAIGGEPEGESPAIATTTSTRCGCPATTAYTLAPVDAGRHPQHPTPTTSWTPTPPTTSGWLTPTTSSPLRLRGGAGDTNEHVFDPPVPYPDTEFALRLEDNLLFALAESTVDLSHVGLRAAPDLEYVQAVWKGLLGDVDVIRRRLQQMWQHGGVDLMRTVQDALEMGVGGAVIQRDVGLLNEFLALFPSHLDWIPLQVWRDWLVAKRRDQPRLVEMEKRKRSESGCSTTTDRGEDCVPRLWAQAMSLWNLREGGDKGSDDDDAKRKEGKKTVCMQLVGREKMLPWNVCAHSKPSPSELHALHEMVQIAREFGCEVDNAWSNEEAGIAWRVLVGELPLPPVPELHAIPSVPTVNAVKEKDIFKWYGNADRTAGVASGRDYFFQGVEKKPYDADDVSEIIEPSSARHVRKDERVAGRESGEEAGGVGGGETSSVAGEVEDAELEDLRWSAFRESLADDPQWIVFTSMPLKAVKWHLIGLMSDCCVILEDPSDLVAYRVLYQLLPQWRAEGSYSSRIAWRSRLPLFSFSVVEALCDEFRQQVIPLPIDEEAEQIAKKVKDNLHSGAVAEAAGASSPRDQTVGARPVWSMIMCCSDPLW